MSASPAPSLSGKPGDRRDGPSGSGLRPHRRGVPSGRSLPAPIRRPGRFPETPGPRKTGRAFGGAGSLGVPGPWTGNCLEGAAFAPRGHRLSPQAGGPAAVRRSLPRRPKPSRNFIPAGDARRRRVTAHPRPARTRPNGSPSPFTHPAAYRTRPGRVLRIRKNPRNAVEPCLVLQDGVLRLSPGSGTWQGSFPRSRPEKPGRARSCPRSPPLVIPLMIPLVIPLMALLGHEAAAPPPASQPRRDPSPGAVWPPDGTPGRPGIAHGEDRVAPGRKARADKVFPGNCRMGTRSSKEKAGRKRSRPVEAKERKTATNAKGRGKGWGGQTERAQKRERGQGGTKGRRAAAKGEGQKIRRRFPLPASLSRERLLLTNSPPPSCPPLALPLPGRRSSPRAPPALAPLPPPARPRPRTARRAPSAQIPRRDPRLRSDPRRIHRGWPGLPSRPRPGPPAIRPCPEGRFPETEAPQSRTTPTSPKARPALSTGFDPPTKNLPRSPSPPPSCPPLPPSPYGTGLRSHQPKRLPRRAFGPTDGLGGQRPFGPGGLPGGEAAARRAPCGRPRAGSAGGARGLSPMRAAKSARATGCSSRNRSASRGPPRPRKPFGRRRIPTSRRTDPPRGAPPPAAQPPDPDPTPAAAAPPAAATAPPPPARSGPTRPDAAPPTPGPPPASGRGCARA